MSNVRGYMYYKNYKNYKNANFGVFFTSLQRGLSTKIIYIFMLITQMCGDICKILSSFLSKNTSFLDKNDHKKHIFSRIMPRKTRKSKKNKFA